MGLELMAEVCEALLKDVTHSEDVIRHMSADALAAAVGQFPDELGTVLQLLVKLYDELNKVRVIDCLVVNN